MIKTEDTTMIVNGAVYKNNYARAAAYFRGTCAPEPKEDYRLAAYGLITGIYNAVYRNSEDIGWKSVPDTYFEPWEQQKGREKDIKSIRGAINKLDELIKELFDLVQCSSISREGFLIPESFVIKRPLQKALTAVGIEPLTLDRELRLSAGCAMGLKELAQISEKNTVAITDGPKEDKKYLFFSRCVYDIEENWIAVAFDRYLKADGRLIAMCCELEKRGFRRIDCIEGKKISLDYVKQHGEKNEPLKQAWAERTHSGISLTFEELRKEPCFLWIRIPMFRTVLEHEADMKQEVAEFIENHTKTCDGCRYCVQTDKTGTRPLAAIRFAGKKKCPNFPGFGFNWRVLDAVLATSVLDVLDTVSEIL